MLQCSLMKKCLRGRPTGIVLLNLLLTAQQLFMLPACYRCPCDRIAALRARYCSKLIFPLSYWISSISSSCSSRLKVRTGALWGWRFTATAAMTVRTAAVIIIAANANPFIPNRVNIAIPLSNFLFLRPCLSIISEQFVFMNICYKINMKGL